MLKLGMKLEGDINIDKFEVEVDCPRCNFANPIWLRQARLRDVVICRGCKANIQLDDNMNTVRKAYRSIRRSMQDLRETVERFNRSSR
jgi:hypothetical protein